MNRAGILVVVLAIFGVVAEATILSNRRSAWRKHTAAAGGAAFSDDFDRANADSLGANWTEAAGDQDIASNVLSLQTSGFAENVCAYTGTACSTVNQYVLCSWVATGSFYPGYILRYSAAASPQYVVFFWIAENKIEWSRKATSGDASFTLIEASGTVTVDTTDRWGVTIDGTGTSTVVRCWKNPTGDTPTNEGDWGGDTTPDVTLTANPATPVDTGNHVGLAGEINTAGGVTFNNFFGGDAP